MSAVPPEIRILSEDVANKIAAGEVVERPAAAVKELLENSIDAGATRIEIEFSRGGKNLIRVTDNGCGMTREQALMSLEPHATSKIRKSEDIFSISTYGFRGTSEHCERELFYPAHAPAGPAVRHRGARPFGDCRKC